jgi:hypothetical protein
MTLVRVSSLLVILLILAGCGRTSLAGPAPEPEPEPEPAREVAVPTGQRCYANGVCAGWYGQIVIDRTKARSITGPTDYTGITATALLAELGLPAEPRPYVHGDTGTRLYPVALAGDDAPLLYVIADDADQIVRLYYSALIPAQRETPAQMTFLGTLAALANPAAGAWIAETIPALGFCQAGGDAPLPKDCAANSNPTTLWGNSYVFKALGGNGPMLWVELPGNQ